MLKYKLTLPSDQSELPLFSPQGGETCLNHFMEVAGSEEGMGGLCKSSCPPRLLSPSPHGLRTSHLPVSVLLHQEANMVPGGPSWKWVQVAQGTLPHTAPTHL